MGIDINILSCNNRSPLHLAVIFENLSLVEYLIQLGVNINALDIYDSTPLSYSHNKKI
jgi:ankyrin repeat protein